MSSSRCCESHFVIDALFLSQTDDGLFNPMYGVNAAGGQHDAHYGGVGGHYDAVGGQLLSYEHVMFCRPMLCSRSCDQS